MTPRPGLNSFENRETVEPNKKWPGCWTWSRQRTPGRSILSCGPAPEMARSKSSMKPSHFATGKSLPENTGQKRPTWNESCDGEESQFLGMICSWRPWDCKRNSRSYAAIAISTRSVRVSSTCKSGNWLNLAWRSERPPRPFLHKNPARSALHSGTG